VFISHIEVINEAVPCIQAHMVYIDVKSFYVPNTCAIHVQYMF